ncbi:MAG TPA: hypothetical protein PKD53_30405, partial [Chloroflexaceae bacterium]|nr:hypothetical protein [Chloroflexaceae bacterium]
MEAQGLTEQGVAALRAGDREAARALLAAAVRADPGDARAWLWLSGALADPAAQRYCLERALALDPASAPARAGLEALGADEHERPHVAARPVGAGVPALSPARRPRPRGLEPERSDGGLPVTPGLERSSALPADPWRLIWRRPRAAVRAALAGRPLWEPWLLAGLAGTSAALSWALWRGLGAAAGPWALLVIGAAAGAPLGAVGLLLGGVLLRTGGRLLGGRAGAAQVRAALAWALAPAAAGLPVGLALLALGPAQGLLAGALWAAQAGLWAWSAAL